MRLQLCLCVLPLAAPFVLQPVTRPRVTTRRTPRAALLVPATETGAGLLAATGVLAWVAPEANLPGFKDYDSTAAAVVRTIGAWQIVLAFALLASAAAGGDGLAERNAPIQYCCDVCGVCPIVGARWHCALCRDFDVCEQCHDGNEEEIGEIHDASHPLERREIPPAPPGDWSLVARDTWPVSATK